MEFSYINQLADDDDFEDIFKNFDFTLLDDLEFKEDAVREEIIFPLLKKLGYSASSKNKIIRSKALKHPFYYFGTKQYNVNIIPDYTFQIDEKNYWILDAKRPQENISEGKNVFQAYSYAMHPEIQSEIYALCNGKELSIFNIRQHTPLLNFKILNLKENWQKLKKCLLPEYVQKPHLKYFSLDLGLFLMMIGDVEIFSEPIEFILKGINDLSKLEDNLYSINGIFGVLGLEGQRFMGTFDFDKVRYNELLTIVPNDMKAEILFSLNKQPFRFLTLKAKENPIKILAVASRKINTNADESFLPFEVIKFEKTEV